MEISNLLLGMSYNMPKMLISEFQSHSIKILDFKMKSRVEMTFFNLLKGIFCNIPNMLISEFQSHSIRIEDFKDIAINYFNPISIKRWNDIY